jgi:hypothetical protein
MGGAGGGWSMDMSGTDEVDGDPKDLKPIIFIVHYAGAGGEPIGEVQVLHIVMKGLLIMDTVSNISAKTRIIGGIQTLRDDVDAHVFGAGAAKIWYSSKALENLPDDVSSMNWNASSWREKHPKKQ